MIGLSWAVCRLSVTAVCPRTVLLRKRSLADFEEDSGGGGVGRVPVVLARNRSRDGGGGRFGVDATESELGGERWIKNDHSPNKHVNTN